MKTLSIIIIFISLSFGAAAQHRVGGYYHGGGTYYHVYSPRVYVNPFGYGYSYYPFGYYGNPYAYGYPYYGNRREPYKLTLEIQSIKADYKTKIRNIRKDKSISHHERRMEIRNLKDQRDQDVIDAQRNFRQSRTNNQNQNNNSLQNSYDNSTNS